jgi:hypothetical protein
MRALFLATIFSLSCAASNWMPESQVKAGTKAAYQTEQSCRASGEPCFDVGARPELVTEGFVSVVESCTAPANITPCDGEQSCAAAQDGLCKEIGGTPFYRETEGGMGEAYCSTCTKSVVLDQAAVQAYDAAKAAKAQSEALIAAGAKADADCKRVLHLIGGFNLQPSRTQEQINGMVSTFGPIVQALTLGRPGVAKAMIQAITPDGTVVTQAMKDLALEQLKDW